MNPIEKLFLGAFYWVPRYGPELRRLREYRDDRWFLELEEPTLAFARPGHFYSPIPSMQEVAKHADRLFDRSMREIPGIELNVEGQLALVDELAGFYAAQPFTDKPEEGRRFGFRNHFFEHSDALFLYGMIRKARPKRIVEMGSGNSSALMLDVNELFFDNTIKLTFIEPYPQSLRSKMKPGDELRSRLLEQPLETVPLDLFASLEAGDILFVDCSHVVKAGSDAQYLFAEIIPRIAPGVLIHIHDIHFPFEYPREWLEEGRYWNEAYVLRSFLQFNDTFRIAAWVHLLWENFSEKLFQAMPLCRESSGASFWMVREK